MDESVLVELTKPIRDKTIVFRRDYGLKIPDAIIAATAFHVDLPLVTMDSDFRKINELNTVILELD